MIIKKDDKIIINPSSILIDYTEKKTKGVVLMADTKEGFTEVSEYYPFPKMAEDLLNRVMANIKMDCREGHEPVVDMDFLEKV